MHSESPVAQWLLRIRVCLRIVHIAGDECDHGNLENEREKFSPSTRTVTTSQRITKGTHHFSDDEANH